MIGNGGGNPGVCRKMLKSQFSRIFELSLFSWLALPPLVKFIREVVYLCQCVLIHVMCVSVFVWWCVHVLVFCMYKDMCVVSMLCVQLCVWSVFVVGYV